MSENENEQEHDHKFVKNYAGEPVHELGHASVNLMAIAFVVVLFIYLVYVTFQVLGMFFG